MILKMKLCDHGEYISLRNIIIFNGTKYYEMNKRNRNNSRKNRYVLVSPTIVKNTSFLNNCNTPFDQSLTHNETKLYPSIVLVMEEEEERKRKKRIRALERDPKRRVRITYFDFTTRVARHSIRFVVRIRN